jgi:hypothetical protein
MISSSQGPGRRGPNAAGRIVRVARRDLSDLNLNLKPAPGPAVRQQCRMASRFLVSLKKSNILKCILKPVLPDAGTVTVTVTETVVGHCTP